MIIKNPYVLAIVVGALHYLGTKYPELRQAVESILIALGVGGGAAFIRSMNGKGIINGSDGGGSGNTGSNSLPATR